MTESGNDKTKTWDWESFYKDGSDLPWDSGKPAEELVEYFTDLKDPALMPDTVLEVGCGTGTNAIWLAQKGCNVTATEIAPTALKNAEARAQKAGIKANLCLADICEKPPVKPASQDFAFDRGVFHVIPVNKRAVFAKNLAASLKKGAYWLSLAGCKDEDREGQQHGPPQLSASELLEHIEPLFEVIKLERSQFVIPSGQTFLSWKALYRRR